MNATSLTVLDLVAIAIVLISAGLAFLRGFVHEVLSIGAWVGAAFAALYGFPVVRPLAREHIAMPLAADIAAGVGLFLVALIVLSIVTSAISRQVQSSGLNSLDRSLGFLFGLLRGGVVVALAFIVLSWVFPPASARPDWIMQARGLPMMERGADILRSLVPANLLEEEDRARSVTQDAQEQAKRAMEAKQLYDRLAQPAPGAPQQQPVAPASGAGLPQTTVQGAPTPTLIGPNGIGANGTPARPPSTAPSLNGQVLSGPQTGAQTGGQTNGQAGTGQAGTGYTDKDRQGINQIIQKTQ